MHLVSLSAIMRYQKGNFTNSKIMEQKTTITKEKIAAHIHEKMGFAKSITEKLILQIFEEIAMILKTGGNIQLPNFGTFSVNTKNTRPGMNMHTQEKMMIPARDVIRFVPSRSLKTMVNDV